MHKSMLRPSLWAIFFWLILFSVSCGVNDENLAGPEPETRTAKITADIGPGVATFTLPVWDPALVSTMQSSPGWAVPMSLPRGTEYSFLNTTPPGSIISWSRYLFRGGHTKTFEATTDSWAIDGYALQAKVVGTGPDFGDIQYQKIGGHPLPTQNYNPAKSSFFVDGYFSVVGGTGYISEARLSAEMYRGNRAVGRKYMGVTARIPTQYNPYPGLFLGIIGGPGTIQDRLIFQLSELYLDSPTGPSPDRVECFIYARIHPGPGTAIAGVDRYGLILSPALVINTPTPGTEYGAGDPVALNGELDGLNNPQWISNVSGNLGSVASLTVCHFSPGTIPGLFTRTIPPALNQNLRFLTREN